MSDTSSSIATPPTRAIIPVVIPTQQAKIILLGHTNTGKSAYVRRLVNNDFRMAKYFPGEETHHEVPDGATKITQLENGQVFSVKIWDCSWDLIDKANQHDLITYFTDANAVVYFTTDSDLNNIDKLDQCIEKTFAAVKRLANPRCLIVLVLNLRFHQMEQTFEHVIQQRARNMKALYRTMDIQQNNGVNESWLEILNTIYYTNVVRDTTLSTYEKNSIGERKSTTTTTTTITTKPIVRSGYCRWILCCIGNTTSADYQDSEEEEEVS